MTFSTSDRSVFSEALLSVCNASAHVVILFFSSFDKSRIRKCEVASDAIAMIIAVITRPIFTCLILSVHIIFSVLL